MNIIISLVCSIRSHCRSEVQLAINRSDSFGGLVASILLLLSSSLERFLRLVVTFRNIKILGAEDARFVLRQGLILDTS
jgi:hypothetical protein